MPRLSRRVWPTFLACAVAGSVAFLLLLAPLLAGLTYIGFDVTFLSLPLQCEFHRALTSDGGLWLSPRLGNGAPLWTRPEAQTLYPLRWLLLLLPPDAAVVGDVALHGLIAAASTAFLARTFRMRPLAAAATGLAYVFTGTFINLIVHGHYITGWSWLPLAWAAGRRTLSRPRPRPYLLLTAAALTLMLVGPEPHSFVIVSGVLAAEAGARLWRRGRASLGVAAAVMVVDGAAFAISLVLWLPALSEMELSPRGNLLDFSAALRWSLTPDLWPAILWPGIFGESTGNLHTVIYGTNVGAWNPSPYLGLLLVGALPAAVASRRARWPLVVALGSLLFAVGDGLPILPWLMRMLPAVATFRFPAKYFALTSLTVVLAAMLGIQDALRRQRLGVLRGSWGVASLVGTGALGAALWWAPVLDGTSPLVDGQVALSSLALHAAVSSLVPVAAALGLTFLPWKRWVPALVVLDLLMAVPSAVFVGPWLEHVPSPVALLGEQEPPIVCQSRGLLTRNLSTSGYCTTPSEALAWRQWVLPELQACEGLVSPFPYSPTMTRIQLWMLDALGTAPERVVRALGCQVYVTEADLPPGPTWEAVDWAEVMRAAAAQGRITPGQAVDPGELQVFRVARVRDPLPEVFFVPHGEAVATEAELKARLLAGMEATTCIDSPLAPVPPVPQGGQVSSVRLERLQPHLLRVTAAGAGGGVVGVRSTYWKGWHAFQGERELPVVRVGGMQLGALVEDVGRGPVEFRYRSPNLRNGFLCLLAGLTAVVLAAGFLGRRRAPARPRS